MISEKDYKSFQSNLEFIIKDTFIENPSEKHIIQDCFWVNKGLWPGTENRLYVYDKRKIDHHKNALLTMCKKLPKYHKPCAQHGGIISCFDLIMDFRKHSSLSRDDVFYQLALSNHFSNLLSATNIAQIQTVNLDGQKAYFLVIDQKYREFMEQEGQEPFDD